LHSIISLLLMEKGGENRKKQVSVTSVK